MSKKSLCILLSIISSLLSVPVYSHSFTSHRADFYAVLPFYESKELDEWMKMISYDLIDNYKGVQRSEYGERSFYDYLREKFPPFKCKHRMLFHWGYNATPWSDALQQKVEGYGWDEEKISLFKKEIVREQQKRNSEANRKTEELFGFASGGKDAGYANAMISLIYDVHMLGDYTPDNSDLDGIVSFSSVIGDLINALRKLDAVESKPLVKDIQNAANNDKDVQIRATDVLMILAEKCPVFLLNAENGTLARRWEKRGLDIRETL